MLISGGSPPEAAWRAGLLDWGDAAGKGPAHLCVIWKSQFGISWERHGTAGGREDAIWHPSRTDTIEDTAASCT